ncbi:MAG TPA: HNH endonuclease [Thermoanaerobaculia bacterium]|jgi:5-methylcytosine-specific restriction endonuclease McrA
MCRWCKGAVSGRRRTFCSDACVHEWRLRSSTSYLRECVFERDKGVCTLCGLDTHKQRRRIMRLPFAERMRELRTLQSAGVIHKGRKTWWEADHILSVVEGGDSNLENMRTLCIPCHKGVTRALRVRRLNS